MGTPVSPEILRRKAAQNGLVLGLFTAACRLISQLVSNAGTVSAGTAVLNGIVWLIQFAGCIWIMKFLMERLVSRYSVTDNAVTAKYGRLLALTSSIIFSAVMFFYMEFVSPDTAAAQMDLIYEMYGSSLDSNTRSALQKIEEHYSRIAFVSTLVYSWLYGVVLSFILSRSIPKQDPFASYMNENDRNNEPEIS